MTARGLFRRAPRAGAIARLVVVIALAVLFGARAARADAEGAPPAADDAALVKSAVDALAQGRPGDAIAGFEALADRGVVDPNMSLDRGLAYAQRVRLGADAPGDLGRAAHGFEEARALTGDPKLDADATRALAAVRAEVARRRARAGEAAGVDPGIPLWRSVVGVANEDTWAALALAASILLGAGLFVRGLSTARRGRIGGAIAASISAPALAAFALLTLAARDERLHRREGVIVAETARPADDAHRPLASAPPLPEAARVQIVDARAGWTHVRWGATDGWIPSSAVRAIARAD